MRSFRQKKYAGISTPDLKLMAAAVSMAEFVASMHEGENCENRWISPNFARCKNECWTFLRALLGHAPDDITIWVGGRKPNGQKLVLTLGEVRAWDTSYFCEDPDRCNDDDCWVDGSSKRYPAVPTAIDLLEHMEERFPGVSAQQEVAVMLARMHAAMDGVQFSEKGWIAKGAPPGEPLQRKRYAIWFFNNKPGTRSFYGVDLTDLELEVVARLAETYMSPADPEEEVHLDSMAHAIKQFDEETPDDMRGLYQDDEGNPRPINEDDLDMFFAHRRGGSIDYIELVTLLEGADEDDIRRQLAEHKPSKHHSHSCTECAE